MAHWVHWLVSISSKSSAILFNFKKEIKVIKNSFIIYKKREWGQVIIKLFFKKSRDVKNRFFGVPPITLWNIKFNCIPFLSKHFWLCPQTKARPLLYLATYFTTPPNIPFAEKNVHHLHEMNVKKISREQKSVYISAKKCKVELTLICIWHWLHHHWRIEVE